MHCAGPVEGQELSILKENVSNEAKTFIFETETLSDAWKILEELYGDKRLIALKVKEKMKNLKPTAKDDHEKVIELKLHVDHLSRRMTLANAEGILDSDYDFINAILKHLPQYEQRRWAEFDYVRHGGFWKGFLAFLSDIERAAKNMRLTALSQNTNDEQRARRNKCDWCQIPGHIESKCMKKQRGVARVIVAGVTTSLPNSKCPLCEKEHMRMDQSSISDWLSSCCLFRQGSPEERIEMATRLSVCFSCTSWLHKTEDFPLKHKTCNHKEGTNICNEEHSRWFHVPSKVVNTSKVTVVSKENENSAEIVAAVSNHEQTTDTLLQIQDVKVHGTEILARTFFDAGSNAVLISHDFANRAGLESEETDFVLQSVMYTQSSQNKNI